MQRRPKHHSRHRFKLLPSLTNAHKSHTNYQKGCKPAAKTMITTILGERAKETIDKIPLSDNTVRHCITLRIHKSRKAISAYTCYRISFAFQQAKTAHVGGMKQTLGIYGVPTWRKMLPGLSFCLSCQSMIRDASITDYLLCESCAGNGTLGWVPELKRPWLP